MGLFVLWEYYVNIHYRKYPLYNVVAMFNYQKLIHKLLVSQFLVAVDLALLNMHEHTCLRLLVLSPMFDI
jgi:hypothetical protein